MSKDYKFYRLNKILKCNAHYNVIFGERSSGKTYAVKERIIKNYFKNGKCGAYIRRWDDDLKGKRGTVLFDDMSNIVKKYSNGEWTQVLYSSRRWYMARYNENTGKIEKDYKPFCYGFGLNVMEHDKSTSYPDIDIICFDEFLTRGTYLTDEFVIFMNVLSTIVRLRKDIEIFMLGNTVNKYCPYFAEMGLTNVKNMKQGDIDVYNYGSSGLRVAVEYTGNDTSGNKESNVLFAFNNPKLQMVTHGNWEIDIYPHLPLRYRPKDILYSFFVEFDGEIVQGDVVGGGFKRVNENIYDVDTFPFIYFHTKTTEIKRAERDYIYSTTVTRFPNWHRSITRPTDKIGKRIKMLFDMDKIFYQTNEVGEIINNFMKWSKSNV